MYIQDKEKNEKILSKEAIIAHEKAATAQKEEEKEAAKAHKEEKEAATHKKEEAEARAQREVVAAHKEEEVEKEKKEEMLHKELHKEDVTAHTKEQKETMAHKEVAALKKKWSATGISAQKEAAALMHQETAVKAQGLQGFKGLKGSLKGSHAWKASQAKVRVRVRVQGLGLGGGCCDSGADAGKVSQGAGKVGGLGFGNQGLEFPFYCSDCR